MCKNPLFLKVYEGPLPHFCCSGFCYPYYGLAPLDVQKDPGEFPNHSSACRLYTFQGGHPSQMAGPAVERCLSHVVLRGGGNSLPYGCRTQNRKTLFVEKLAETFAATPYHDAALHGLCLSSWESFFAFERSFKPPLGCCPGAD